MHVPSSSFDGMNWLAEPDPHVQVLDMLVSDGREHRWLARLSDRPASVEHLRTSILDCFPFSARGRKPRISTKPLWDQRVVTYSLDASMNAAVSANIPLARCLGSLESAVHSSAAKLLVFEFSNVTAKVAELLVLLNEHLEQQSAHGQSREIQAALMEGRVYVVVEAYFTTAIRIYDSTSLASKAGAKASVPQAQFKVDAELIERSTLLFERSAAAPPAAFGIKVKRIGYNEGDRRLYLGKRRDVRVRSGDESEMISDLPGMLTVS